MEEAWQPVCSHQVRTEENKDTVHYAISYEDFQAFDCKIAPLNGGVTYIIISSTKTTSLCLAASSVGRVELGRQRAPSCCWSFSQWWVRTQQALLCQRGAPGWSRPSSRAGTGWPAGHTQSLRVFTFKTFKSHKHVFCVIIFGILHTLILGLGCCGLILESLTCGPLSYFLFLAFIFMYFVYVSMFCLNDGFYSSPRQVTNHIQVMAMRLTLLNSASCYSWMSSLW